MGTTPSTKLFLNPIVAQKVAVNGIELYTRTAGSGPDVVVLHGGPSASHISLLPALDGLAGARRLRYYDQRGCGQSHVAASVSLDWQSHVDDLRSLLDVWRIEAATVIAHSWGALLCLLFTIQDPQRIERMLLVAPASITTAGRYAFLEELNRRIAELGILGRQRELLRSDLRKRDPEAFRRRAFELSLAPYLRVSTQTLDLQPFRISHRAREAVWRSLGDYDLTGEIAEISVPALVIHGRFDPIPLASSELLAGLLGARLEIFEDSGHMPFVEEGARFLDVAEEFLPSGETKTVETDGDRRPRIDLT